MEVNLTAIDLIAYHWRSKFGLPGLVGLLLLTSVVAVATFEIGTRIGDGAQVNHASTHASTHPGGAQVEPQEIAHRRAERILAAFNSRFPDESTLLPTLRQLTAMAHEHGLSNIAVRPGQRSGGTGTLVDVEVSLTATATYPSLRRFIDTVRKRFDSAAVLKLEATRRTIDEPALRVACSLLFSFARE